MNVDKEVELRGVPSVIALLLNMLVTDEGNNEAPAVFKFHTCSRETNPL